ncbi:unnamed protein product [Symbiodinium natans]|uniref:Uncharacterized protein n=1 Tax=Symbiodinium natans TaxID=878477 RepID=A0A812II52_9DINO|nr:unnamed protein product [Symbiodinium natans]
MASGHAADFASVEYGAQALIEMGPTVVEVRPKDVLETVSALVDIFIRHPDESVAGQLLSELGPMMACPEVARKLLALLASDLEQSSRRRVAQAMALLGPASARACKGFVKKLVELLSDSDDELQKSAAVAMGQLGACKNLVSKLVDWRTDSDLHKQSIAADVLLQLGPASVPKRLMELFQDPAASMRCFSAEAMGMQGPSAAEACPEAVSKLVDLMLADPDLYVRLTAAQALKQLGPTIATDCPEAISKLIESLADPDQPGRCYAAEALLQLGPAMVEVRPDFMFHLVELLEDPDASVRGAAAEAVGELSLEHLKGCPKAVLGLVRLLEDEKEEVRSRAEGAVRRLGPAIRPSLEKLLNLLGDDEWQAADLIGELGPTAVDCAQALCKLETLLEAPDKQVRITAATSLGKLGPKAVQAVPRLAELLVQMLEDSDSEVRDRAAQVFGELGPSASEACPWGVRRLAQLLKDPELEVRISATESLGHFGVSVLKACPDCVQTLLELPAEMSREKALAMRKLGLVTHPAFQEAVCKVVDSLADPDWMTRHQVVIALEQLGPAAAQALLAKQEMVLEALQDGVEDPEGTLCQHLCQALITCLDASGASGSGQQHRLALLRAAAVSVSNDNGQKNVLLRHVASSRASNGSELELGVVCVQDKFNLKASKAVAGPVKAVGSIGSE